LEELLLDVPERLPLLVLELPPRAFRMACMVSCFCAQRRLSRRVVRLLALLLVMSDCCVLMELKVLVVVGKAVFYVVGARMGLCTFEFCVASSLRQLTWSHDGAFGVHLRP
jgi:hypothetical protein